MKLHLYLNDLRIFTITILVETSISPNGANEQPYSNGYKIFRLLQISVRTAVTLAKCTNSSEKKKRCEINK